jgi:predicted transposase/invertase (TIGR01784 family)
VIDVVPLRYGTAFKKAFSDPEVFSGFVRDVLGLELQFTHIEQEKAFLAPIGNVDVRFDLYGEDVEHRVIVELQHVREEDAFARFHYYHLVSQIEQVTSSRNYNIDRTVYTIVVLTRLPTERHLRFDVASQSSDLVTLDGRQLGLFKHRIVFVNPRAITGSTPEPLRRWLELIEDSLDEKIDESVYSNPLFLKVISSIETTHLTPREMYWFKEEAIWEDTKDAEYRRGEEQGLKEGHDKGLKEGHDKGLKEGHDKGLKEGLKKAIFDACDLLDIMLDEPQKAHIETLDADALETLRAQIKKAKRWPDG